jgi:chromate reductase
MPKIAMLIGSLRKDSINRKLGHAIARHAEGKLDIVTPDLDLPLYNEDLWASPPAGVTALKDAIASADGVIIVTPEYNRMTTPIIINALDWANRPYGDNSLAGKPVTLAGASPGAQGTAVAQNLLRNFLTVTGMHVMSGTEIYLTVRDDFFSADGDFANEKTGAFIDKWIDDFTKWIGHF